MMSSLSAQCATCQELSHRAISGVREGAAFSSQWQVDWHDKNEVGTITAKMAKAFDEKMPWRTHCNGHQHYHWEMSPLQTSYATNCPPWILHEELAGKWCQGAGESQVDLALT